MNIAHTWYGYRCDGFYRKYGLKTNRKSDISVLCARKWYFKCVAIFMTQNTQKRSLLSRFSRFDA